MAGLTRARVLRTVRIPIRAAARVSAPSRLRAETLARRPRPASRVPGRSPRGPVPAFPVPVPPAPAVVPEAGDPAVGGLAAEGQAASPAGTVTRAVKPTWIERRARPDRQGPRATIGPPRFSRARPAGQAGSRRAALKKPVAGPAVQRGQAGRRQRPAPVGHPPAGCLPAGPRGRARGFPGSGCGREPPW
jgi:hypothetical protein